MARQLSDQTVQLSGTPLAFRWPGNEAFLKGTRRRPQTFSWNVGESLIYIYNLSFFGYVTLTLIVNIAFIAIWHSPLAVETTAMIDGYQDGTVSYHYFTGGTRHDKIEQASRFEPTWDSLEPRQPVVYLIFDPSRSSLDFNVHPETYPGSDAANNALNLLLLAHFAHIAWKEIRHYRHRLVLRDEATHLLEARIIKNSRDRWGWTTYTYAAKSPKSDAEIRGKFSIVRSSPRTSDFQQGTLVAILYRDDKLHAVL